jgi:alpha-beta hydrolase superfamily lysophospholipase
VGDEDSVTTISKKIRPRLTIKWLVIPVLLIAFCIVACGGQPLEPWHTARLSSEFTAKDIDEVRTFEDYLALEDRLFHEVLDEIYVDVPTGPEFALVRYSSGSLSDPETRTPNFNRSFELSADNPRGGVLLLHGLTDSPYSLRALGELLNERALGELLNEKGYWVVGLRLPGHGTIPSSLRFARWQDMAAATRIAMAHIAEKVGQGPVHIAGYSNGAALALDHALESIDDPEVPKPASLILISPSIGVSAAAALAGPTATISKVPGLGRLAWSQTTLEFDPYKYNSFPVNGGAIARGLTQSVASRIATLSQTDQAASFPPVLVFKSAVDATVSIDAVVDRLLARLPDNGNELVLFDINRSAVHSILLVSDPGPITSRLMQDDSLPFAITLVANDNPTSPSIVTRYKPPFSAEITRTDDLDLEWPQGIISLSHVALPFAPDDPLYGQFRPQQKEVLYLGQIAIRGERGLMKLSNDWLLRLRFNPFYSILENRVTEWVFTKD